MVAKLTPKFFNDEIQRIVNQGDTEYIDAVIHYCDQNGIEYDVAASLIKNNSNLKACVKAEAETLNFLEKTSEQFKYSEDPDK